jgi:dipicolinate synthase subunit B
LGPKIKLDAMIICPCTGNTMAKIANGITDTAVTMAAKAHLRNNNPLLIALATNDALSANLKNIGALLSRKNIYFVPMSQDDPLSKPHSMVADFDMVKDSLEMAIQGKQIPKLFK